MPLPIDAKVFESRIVRQLAQLMPIVRWLPQYQRSWLRFDLVDDPLGVRRELRVGSVRDGDVGARGRVVDVQDGLGVRRHHIGVARAIRCPFAVGRELRRVDRLPFRVVVDGEDLLV